MRVPPEHASRRARVERSWGGGIRIKEREVGCEAWGAGGRGKGKGWSVSRSEQWSRKYLQKPTMPLIRFSRALTHAR